MLIMSGCGGIGGVIGPICLRLMGVKAYWLFALVMGVTIPSFLTMECPFQLKKQDQ